MFDQLHFERTNLSAVKQMVLRDVTMELNHVGLGT